MSHSTDEYLARDEEETLLRIARSALELYVREGLSVDVDDFELTETLLEPHGAFVTLRKGGDLRGCIGYTSNTKPLAIAVRDSAISSASNDPRFSPVSRDELAEISVEVSALALGDRPDTPYRRVACIDEIVVGRDGLFIEGRSGGGLLLPQVAVEQGWDVPQFLSALCRKASLPEGAWEEPDTRLYRFSAQVFGESDDRG